MSLSHLQTGNLLHVFEETIIYVNKYFEYDKRSGINSYQFSCGFHHIINLEVSFNLVHNRNGLLIYLYNFHIV